MSHSGVFSYMGFVYTLCVVFGLARGRQVFLESGQRAGVQCVSWSRACSACGGQVLTGRGRSLTDIEDGGGQKRDMKTWAYFGVVCRYRSIATN
jgi:hypothetical protein